MKTASDTLKIDCPRVTSLICQFIQKRFRVAGAKGVVVGISGGIDSAVTSFLCTKALGPEAVMGVLLPETNTPVSEIKDAELVVSHLGIRSKQISIESLVNESCRLLPDAAESKLVLGNVKARLRMVLWYALANSTGSLVAGTGNKTEIMVGYSTKFGDAAYDFNPIGDLYKTQVRQLAEYLGVPKTIIKKPPSAGLWPGQTDEDELGISYDHLDMILAACERWSNISEISEELGLPEEVVSRVSRLIRRSEHKRQPPVILKLSYRTSGIDWRLPLA
ncbi:MAG: NAD+ synthase [Candidatus Heimdallarchaeota archaeon]